MPLSLVFTVFYSSVITYLSNFPLYHLVEIISRTHSYLFHSKEKSLALIICDFLTSIFWMFVTHLKNILSVPFLPWRYSNHYCSMVNSHVKFYSLFIETFWHLIIYFLLNPLHFRFTVCVILSVFSTNLINTQKDILYLYLIIF